MPSAGRLSEPAKMTSSDLRLRSARPCSPSAQRRPSARLLLPEPFGPTTALMPAPNSTAVRSANDLKPVQAQGEQPGARSLGSPDRRVRRARHQRAAAGASSATAAARLGNPPGRPLAPPDDLAADADLDPEARSWSGPDTPTRR